jgi:ketosteroid isomerase-like protein
VASANLDLVRSLYAAWERGDFTNIDWADPEIEFVIADGPAAGSWTGLTGMAEGFRELVSAWAQHSIEPQEYHELDSETVLVLARVRGRAKMSGLDLEQMQAKTATLFHIRDHKVMRLVVYGDPEQARTDLGLASEAGSAP